MQLKINRSAAVEFIYLFVSWCSDEVIVSLRIRRICFPMCNWSLQQWTVDKVVVCTSHGVYS